MADYIKNLGFLSDSENAQRDTIIQEINNGVQQRDQPYPELDDMSYPMWYIANKKAATGYMRPKKNKDDLRIVTGTTREKVNTITTSLLRYSFDFEIVAFDDQDWPNKDLGRGVEALVRKSRQLEDPVYDEKRALWYNEFGSQGNLFLYEMAVEENCIKKTMENNNFGDPFQAKWTEKKYIDKRCETVMIPGLNVILGNIREKFMTKQPFVGIRRELHISQIEKIYGESKRWQAVKEANSKVTLDQGNREYDTYSSMPIQKDFKEEILYFNTFTNTFQILVAGIPMLPAGFPLEFALGVNKYPIIKVDGEPISAVFAYCRGIATKNKFNQAMLDEMFRIIALKFRKSTNPPMANLTGKMLNKSIFEPGTVHQGVDPEKLKPIGNNSPMTGPEFDTFQLVKKAIDESSVSPILQGNSTPGQQTAQEITTLKAQSLLALGMIMVGCIQMEEQLIWLRANNILRNWTSPIDSTLEDVKGQIKRINKFKSISTEMPMDTGQMGVQVVNMTDSANMPHPEQVQAADEYLSNKKGVPIQTIYLDAEDISTLRYRLFVKVTPVEKDHSELKAALYQESISQAKTLFPGQVNDAYAREEWANNSKLDSRRLWLPSPQPGAAPPGTPPTAGQPGSSPSPSGPSTPQPVKTVSAQAFPQTTQKMKPGLKRML